MNRKESRTHGSQIRRRIHHVVQAETAKVADASTETIDRELARIMVHGDRARPAHPARHLLDLCTRRPVWMVIPAVVASCAFVLIGHVTVAAIGWAFSGVTVLVPLLVIELADLRRRQVKRVSARNARDDSAGTNGRQAAGSCRDHH
jgi:hypothetical protein